jgi:glutathione synthase/RimK-type ligase-like ATP-grasp enzyme
VQRLLEELDSLGAPYVAVNQRHFAETDLTLTLGPEGVLGGTLTYQQRPYPLADMHGLYVRLVDDEVLPEFQRLAPHDPLRAHARQLIQHLSLWAEWSGARTVNRLAAMASNNSKPYQAQFIQRHGFLTPETLITNDPDAATTFCEHHAGRVIYKSISGVRSIVQAWDPAADLANLGRIRHCPTQFQEQVPGFDVRVHVIGELTLAIRIAADATDYRYAMQQTGAAATLTAYDLDPEVAANCVALSQALELDFSGIDLRFAPNGDVYCFEVNPCPGYTYYEAHTGQPIAARLAEYLTEDDAYYRRIWNV